MTAKLDSTPSAGRELTLTRVIDAPRALVFEAWTDPKHLAQWWGPHGFTNPVCELDLRPGGTLRILMRAPDGTDYPMKGVFREIVAPERLVFTTMPIDADGNHLIEGLTTVIFEEHGRGKTKLTVETRARALAPAAVRMIEGMEAGWTQSLERLEAVVARAGGKTGRGADDESQIRGVLEDRTRALRDKDADLAVAHLAEDAVSFTLAPPLQFAGAAARDKAALKAWFDTWRGSIGWELRNLDISVADDLAFTRALGHMTGTKTDGEAIDLWVRSTVCFRRIGGTWKIVHEHTSVPFYMDGSYKAAVDLKP